jgi:hypothetical protein
VKFSVAVVARRGLSNLDYLPDSALNRQYSAMFRAGLMQLVQPRKRAGQMGIEDLLGGALGGDAMAKIAAKLGTDTAGAQKAVSSALPALLGKMKANADDPEKGSALAGGILDDDDAIGQGGKIVGKVFGDEADAVNDQVAAEAGIDKGQAAGLMGMLAPLVMGALGQSGAAAGGAQGLSGSLGGMLGGGGGGGLGGLLGGLLGGGGGALGGLGSMLGGGAAQAGGAASGAAGAAGGMMGKVTGMLDQNKDGSIIDDVTRMAGGLSGAGGAAGGKAGILGKLMGMFGRK